MKYLKTYENYKTLLEGNETNSDALKELWIKKNGKPKSKEQMETMLQYIRQTINMNNEEPSINYIGQKTRNITH